MIATKTRGSLLGSRKTDEVSNEVQQKHQLLFDQGQ